MGIRGNVLTGAGGRIHCHRSRNLHL